MSLGDHLRELRNRITISAIAIVIGGVVGWIYYDRVINALTKPLRDLQVGREGVVNINFAGMTDAFALQLTTSLFVGLIIASPIWLFQIWGFIVPGLTKKEKLVARLFVVAAVPLFLAGCFFAFVMVPKAVAVLLGFTPAGRLQPPGRVAVPQLRAEVHRRLRLRVPAAGLPRRAQPRRRAAGAGRCSRAGVRPS